MKPAFRTCSLQNRLVLENSKSQNLVITSGDIRWIRDRVNSLRLQTIYLLFNSASLHLDIYGLGFPFDVLLPWKAFCTLSKMAKILRQLCCQILLYDTTLFKPAKPAKDEGLKIQSTKYKVFKKHCMLKLQTLSKLCKSTFFQNNTAL